jgi:hypothetical protein
MMVFFLSEALPFLNRKVSDRPNFLTVSERFMIVSSLKKVRKRSWNVHANGQERRTPWHVRSNTQQRLRI